MIVTIDGPSGAGKTAVAALVAKDLDLPFVPSGLLYRAAGWLAKQSGVPLQSNEAVDTFASQLALRVSKTGRVMSHGKDITNFLDGADIGLAAATIAGHPKLRQYLTRLQQELGLDRGCVIEGRSTAIEVFPEADVKIWLTATIEERMRRKRQAIKSIEARDAIDRQRLLAPMEKAEGVIEVDSTNLSIKEVANRIVAECHKLGLARST